MEEPASCFRSPLLTLPAPPACAPPEGSAPILLACQARDPEKRGSERTAPGGLTPWKEPLAETEPWPRGGLSRASAVPLHQCIAGLDSGNTRPQA